MHVHVVVIHGVLRTKHEGLTMVNKSFRPEIEAMNSSHVQWCTAIFILHTGAHSYINNMNVVSIICNR